MTTPYIIKKSYVDANPIRITAKNLKGFTIFNLGTSILYFNIDDDASSDKIELQIGQAFYYDCEIEPVNNFISVLLQSGGKLQIVFGAISKEYRKTLGDDIKQIGGSIVA